MAANRATTRRRSARIAFDDDDAPVVKRARTETNSIAKKVNGTTKKTDKKAYDEDDDGFQFARRTSRRTTKAQNVPEAIPEDAPAPPPAARRKKTSASVPEPEPEQAEPKRRRRSARLSGEKERLRQVDGSADVSKAVAPRTKKVAPVEKVDKVEKVRKKQVDPAPEKQLETKKIPTGLQTPKQNNELHVPKTRDGGATKIMLPFADTPVIARNKEMRKASKDGHRRSSTGLRGRRASSLIDSGMSNALPHAQVEVRDFYKAIEQSLPEPRRMKQLMIWCGSRALLEKPIGDVKNGNAIMAARAIQQELIDDFANKPELSDWFSREDVAPSTVVKKPNPQNERIKTMLEEMDEEVKRLEEEKAAWEALASSSTSMPPPAPPTIQSTTPTFADIDASLLDPSQASILASLHPPQPSQSSEEPPLQPQSSAFTFRFTTPAALEAHLTRLSDSLEPSIDLFADGVHKIEQYRNTAERVADRVLGTASKRLEERDREGRKQVGSEGIGVGDVLRGLAGVLNES